MSCKYTLSAGDVEFILNALDPEGRQKEDLERLLTDESLRGCILDHPKLLENILEHTGCVSVSPGLYFYVVTRHCLLKKGIEDPALSDYLGRVLCHFSTTRILRQSSAEEQGRHLFPYVSDMLLEIKDASAEVSVQKRIELGDMTLFLTGIFFGVIESRRCHRAAPSVDFYESVGASQYRMVSEDRLVRDSSEARIFRDLSEVFHGLRLALNDLAERLLHMDGSSNLVIPST